MTAEKLGYKVGQWLHNHPRIHMILFLVFFAALMFVGAILMLDEISNARIAGIIAFAIVAAKLGLKINKSAR